MMASRAQKGTAIVAMATATIFNAFALLQASTNQMYLNRAQRSSKGLLDAKKRLARISLAILLLETRESMKPGRGYVTGGIPRAPNCIGHANIGMIERILSNPKKCMRQIGLTGKEFEFIFNFAEPAIRNNFRGAHYREKKMSIRGRLFLLLHYHMNCGLRFDGDLESQYGWSKSSINDDIRFLTPLLSRTIKEQLGILWPSRAHRDVAKRFLPEIFQSLDAKPIGSVDHMKIANMDSIYAKTRTRHYNTHKGFGVNAMTVTNQFGQVIYAEAYSHGRCADQSLWQESALYLGQNGLDVDDDECLCTDHGYFGGSSSRPGSADLLQSIPVQDILMIVDDEEADLAEQFNGAVHSFRASVEQVNGGVKHSGRIPALRTTLHTVVGEEIVTDMIEFGFYLHIIKTRMRGQCFNGNPANFQRGKKGLDRVEWIIAEYLEEGLATAPGRKEVFFGPALAGFQHADEVIDPLPL